MSIEGLSKTKKRIIYYVALAVACCIGVTLVFLYAYIHGQVPIWRSDASSLYLNFSIFEGQTIRDLVSGLFQGSPQDIPMYTFSMGYGSDVITAMSSNVCDPFTLVFALCPVEHSEICYVALIYVRVVLAAFAFSAYSFSKSRRMRATFVAALVYAFCGYMTLWGMMRHPNFLVLGIYLPIICMGADRLFEGKKPYLFIVMMAFTAMFSVYFTYMTCLFLLVYCLVKYFAVSRERSVRDFALLVAKFIGCLALAFCMAAAVMLPMVTSLMSQGRATGGASIPLFRDLADYLRMPGFLVGANTGIWGMYIGVVATVMVAVFLFSRKRFSRDEWLPWTLGVGISIVVVLIPAACSVTNGFNYPTDRWMIAFGFVSANIVAIMFEKLPQLEKRERRCTIVVVAVIALFVVVFLVARGAMGSKPSEAIWPSISVVFLAAGTLVVLWSKAKTSVARSACLSALVLAGLGFTCFMYCAPYGANYAVDFPKNGKALALLSSDSPAAAFSEFASDSKDKVRYSTPSVYNNRRNVGLYYGAMAVDFYSSLYNQGVDDLRMGLGISDDFRNYVFTGSDGRFALDFLAGAEYMVAKESDTQRVPNGFSEIGRSKAGYIVYRAEKALPIVFSSNKAIALDAYEQLGMVERQEALLKGVVLSDDDASGLAQSDTQVSAVPVSHEVVSADGLRVEDGQIVSLKAKSSMKIRFEGRPQSETYLCFNGLRYQGLNPTDLAAENGDTSFNLKYRISDILWSERSSYAISVDDGRGTNSIAPVTPRNNGYGGKVNWAINMGYTEAAQTEFTITFSHAGIYHFTDLSVVCQPMAPMVEAASTLDTGRVDDFTLRTNAIDATATLPADATGPELVVATVPYSSGWEATVDGRPVDIAVADVGFMGVKVEGAGTHEIHLTYCMPGLKTGALLAVAGWIVFALVVIVGAVRSRASQKPLGKHGRAA